MSWPIRPANKDMYWFAHGGTETLTDKCLTQRGDEDENESNSFMGKNISDRRGIPEEQKSYSRDISLTDGGSSSGPASLERDDRLHYIDKRTAVEERRKLLWEAEQERNDAVMKKHMEREAALEARRNAQRSTISFAFGSSVPRNVETLHTHQNSESDSMSRSFTTGGSSYREENHNYYPDRRSVSPFNYNGFDGLSHQPDSSLSSHSETKTNSQLCCLVGSGALFGEDLMTKSMTASISAPRGRRKNDLMPTVPYDRTATPRVATSSSSRRRSVSMTRLDQLALPRKHYVEATKAHSTASSGASSMLKDGCSPNRPLSSASEHSGGGRLSSSVIRRVRSSPRKPRPVSIAGTVPDQKHLTSSKPHELRVTPTRRSYTPLKKSVEVSDVKKAQSSAATHSTPKSTEKLKSTPRPSTATVKVNTPKSATPKQTTAKATPKPKKPENKLATSKAVQSPTNSTPKMQISKNSLTNKRKNDLLVSSSATSQVKDKPDQEEKSCSPPPDSDTATENDKNGKRIISEEEAKAALAEKRRLAREQAEREAELERQRQEELKRLDEERLILEEEEQRKMEEEHMRLIEEHRRQEEEKLRKAIEDQEQKEEEERSKRDEEMRLKAEQERKAKEEAEKLRLELEEKLRKEEEERAERKKRLEKIMSRTRGKSSGTSPSGSISGSDQLDSGENQQEGFSSGANSLESNDGRELPSESVSSDDAMAKMEVSSGGNSIEANLTYEFSSNDVSLNSNDLMLPASETASQDNSIILEKGYLQEESVVNTESSDAITPINQEKNSVLIEANDDFSIQTQEIPVICHQEVTSEKEAFKIQSENTTGCVEVEKIEVKSDIKSEEGIAENLLAEIQLPGEAVSDFVENSSLTPNHQQDLHLSNDTVSTADDDINGLSIVKNELVNDSEVIKKLDVEKSDVDVPSNELHDVITDLVVEDSSSPETLQQNFTSSEDNVDLKLQDNLFSTSIVSDELDKSVHQDFDKFEENENLANPFSDATTTNQDSSTVKTQVEFATSGFEDNYTEKQDSIEQPRELSEENLFASRHPAELNEDFTTAEVFQNIQEEEIHTLKDNSDFNMSTSIFDNQNFVDNLSAGDSEMISNSAFTTNSQFMGSAGDVLKFETSDIEEGSAGDNPFISKLIPGENALNLFHSQLENNQILESEQIITENQVIAKSSDIPVQENLDNVTLIKEEGSENYVGIISSIDNDRISNNFSKLHEQLNNYECASTTDTEDSSLDSNLSQVAAVDDSDQNVNMSLNNVENSVFATDSVHLDSNNIGHSDNPFMTGGVLNQSSIPQSNHYSVSEVYSNGHGVESSQTSADFMQLDGNSILCVDHSKNNIFENVDTIDYDKVSPDPFLVKGTSKQIPGNPFLLQDDQNQVLMSSDFLN